MSHANLQRPFQFLSSLQSLYRLCTTGRGSSLSPIRGLYLDGRASLWFCVPRDPTVRQYDARPPVSANSVNALGKFKLPRPLEAEPPAFQRGRRTDDGKL